MPLKLYSIGVECEAYSSGVMWYIPHGGAQILILEILYIITKALTSWRLRLKFSPSLTLTKIERFETGSIVSLKIMVLYLQISNSDEVVKSPFPDDFEKSSACKARKA